MTRAPENRTARQDLITLFQNTFTASEGAAEGRVIATFVTGMLEQTEARDLRVFTRCEGPDLVAGVLFSRLDYGADSRRVMILSPMAVAPARQGVGIGQSLITHALGVLKDEGVDIVLTYGDPNFYGKVGFLPVTVAQAAAPQPLSHPEGWIGQALTEQPPPSGGAFAPLRGPCRCVPALDDPAFW